MILTHKKRWVRVASALPAVVLALLVLSVVSAFTGAVVLPVLLGATYTPPGGAVFGATAAAQALVLLLALPVYACLALFFLAFARALLTDAGAVPAAYLQRHAGLARVFRRLMTGGGFVTPRSPPPPPLLPAFLRGRVVSGGLGGNGAGGRRDSRRDTWPTTQTLPSPPQPPPPSILQHGGTATSPPSGAASLEDVTVRVGPATEPAAAPAATMSPPVSPSASTANTLGSSSRGPPGGGPLVVRVPEFAIDARALAEPGPHDPRWCRKCAQIKPPRCHHCSFCQRCVTKMDHHCPWVGNCVGFGNYKSFVLVLLHGLLAALFSLLLWAPLMLGLWRPFALLSAGPGGNTGGGEAGLDAANARFTFAFAGGSAIFGFTLDVSLAVSLCVLSGTHVWLILTGRSTLEAQWRGPHPYNLGSPRRNWEAVMGTPPLLWLWPQAVPPEVREATRDGTEWRRALNSRDPPPPLFEYPLPDGDVEDGEVEKAGREDEGEEDALV